jgi:hypothetical protein
MLMPELKEVDKSGRLSILNRKTIKMDYEGHRNKREYDIFNISSRINFKNIDRQEVEKNVEAKLRVTDLLHRKLLHISSDREMRDSTRLT